MKKKKSTNRKRIAKRTPAPKTVDEYFSRVPQSSRSTLNKMRATIRSAIPKDSVEVISYGIPAFKQERILVWYAAFSNHCSLFPTAAIIEQFKNDLKPFSKSKGTVQFPTDKPLPTALVKKLVKARRPSQNQKIPLIP